MSKTILLDSVPASVDLNSLRFGCPKIWNTFYALTHSVESTTTAGATRFLLDRGYGFHSNFGLNSTLFLSESWFDQ